MNGIKFLRMLKQRRIPFSCFAARANTTLEQIYRIRDVERVPSHYLHVLRRDYQHNLTAEDISRLNTI